MEPTAADQEREAERQQERLTTAAHQVEAALTAPLEIPSVPQPSSKLSEMAQLVELLQLAVARVDQVVRFNQEQSARNAQVMQEMQATMQLCQEMIAQQDDQVERQRATGDKLELLGAALVKINANLSEIVAALLTPQKG